MSSLADLPELVGFFSYSREDDADSHGALSTLRTRIQGELRSQLGRTSKAFRLWQDKEAIPAGKLWKAEIETAAAQSVFFIPIITPTVVRSEFCHFELTQFLAREAALGRDDLIFPILYIRVPALEDGTRREDASVTSIIAKRQYVDWRAFRHRAVNSLEVMEAVESFCTHICDALSKPWLSPEERQSRENAAALQRAEAEHKRQQAETATLHREEETHRKAEALARGRTEEEPRKLEPEAARGRTPETKAKQAVEDRGRRPGAISVDVGLPGSSEVRFLVPGAGRTEWFKDLNGGPEMVVVPAGKFVMGSPPSEFAGTEIERPQHEVTFAKPFAVSRFAVTFDEWECCASDGGCGGYMPADAGWGRGRRPVIYVSHDDAKAYVAWLAEKTGKPYRMLSEAEWEYVARAGTTTPYWWGDSISTGQANYAGTKAVWSEDRHRTLPVISFESNPWGLYQVHGNVCEWTDDCYNSDYNGAPIDGSVWTSGVCRSRIVRGGSWESIPGLLRSAFRLGITAGDRVNSLGFRIGRTLPAP